MQNHLSLLSEIVFLSLSWQTLGHTAIASIKVISHIDKTFQQFEKHQQEVEKCEANKSRTNFTKICWVALGDTWFVDSGGRF